jgi:hypothetical protein
VRRAISRSPAAWHIELLGHLGIGWLDPQGLKLGSLLSQVEEELALSLRRSELDEPPVVQNEPQDVGANPPSGVRGELDAAVGVVALDRLHQADVPLLNEVHDVSVSAAIFVGNFYDEPKIGRDQSGRHFRVLRGHEALGEGLRLLGTKERVPLDLA